MCPSRGHISLIHEPDGSAQQGSRLMPLWGGLWSRTLEMQFTEMHTVAVPPRNLQRQTLFPMQVTMGQVWGAEEPHSHSGWSAFALTEARAACFRVVCRPCLGLS